jgi:hypothetical protein
LRRWRNAQVEFTLLMLDSREDRLGGDLPVVPICRNRLVDRTPKSKAESARLAPHEGRIAIVTDAGWDAVDADAPLTNGADADGEVVWS